MLERLEIDGEPYVPSTSAVYCASHQASRHRALVATRREPLRVVMGDGTEFDAHAGDVTALPQGHDAWVVGDEPVIVVDWFGASNYAR